MVMLHITESCDMRQTELWDFLMHWSYYFMCFFFFKAGYFNKTVGGDSLAYCKDKAKRLMLPYVSWGLIAFCIYAFFCIFIFPPNNTAVKILHWSHLWETSMVYGNAPCWFLMSFFSAYIAIHFIEKVRHLHWIILGFPVIGYFLWKWGNPIWLDLNNVFMGLFFFFLGQQWHRLLRHLGNKRILALSIVMTIAFGIINSQTSVAYTMSSNNWVGDPYITMVCLVLALCGISGILLALPTPRIPLINFVGQHSMVFFVAHYPILTFYKFVKSASVHTMRHHIDDYILVTILIFSICFWILPYVEATPWLSGRFKKVVQNP